VQFVPCRHLSLSHSPPPSRYPFLHFCTKIGVTGKYSWLWSFQDPTHTDPSPLLFDNDYNAKPAFFEVLAVLQGK
jgi:GH35 family endo-1,4-beta-xylanase